VAQEVAVTVHEQQQPEQQQQQQTNKRTEFKRINPNFIDALHALNAFCDRDRGR
jgi:hypothetical protein